MGKKSSSTSVSHRREKWKNGYHSVARKNGKFIATAKWQGKSSTNYVDWKIQQKIPEYKPTEKFVPFVPWDSHWIYVVTAKDKSGKEKHLVASSPDFIKMPKGSANRKMLFEYLKKKYEDYDFSIKSMKLQMSYNTDTHERIGGALPGKWPGE